MPPDHRPLYDWVGLVRLNGHEHLVILPGRDEQDPHRHLAAAALRRSLAFLVLYGTDRKLRVDWGNVTSWSIERLARLRTWGPDGEIVWRRPADWPWLPEDDEPSGSE